MFAFLWKDGETIGHLTLLGATLSSEDLAMVWNRTKHRAKPLLPIDTDDPDDSLIASLRTKVTFFLPTDNEPTILQVNLLSNNFEREEQVMTSQEYSKRICERTHIDHAKIHWNKLGCIDLHHHNSNESTYNDYIAWYNEETQSVLKRGSPKNFHRSLYKPLIIGSSPLPPTDLVNSKYTHASRCHPRSPSSEHDGIQDPVEFAGDPSQSPSSDCDGPQEHIHHHWRSWQQQNQPLPSLVYMPEGPPVHWRHRPFKLWKKKVFAYLIECWIPGLRMKQEMIEDIQ
jgi:hypothetical protein